MFLRRLVPSTLAIYDFITLRGQKLEEGTSEKLDQQDHCVHMAVNDYRC